MIDERVNEFIDSLPVVVKAECIQIMELLIKEGHNLRMPYTKKIHSKIWELRIRGKIQIRIFYYIKDQQAHLLHIFIKKSNKTPKKELSTAIKRIREI